MYDVLAFLTLALAALGLALALSRSGRVPFPRALLLGAVGARVLGSLLRYEVLERYYAGLGDANTYYREGLALASGLRRLELSSFGLLDLPLHVERWGTQVVTVASGLVLTFTGPTMRGEFLVFSLLAFLGLYSIAVAARRTMSSPSAVRFAAWIWLWPSLWFWPSSVGKEALIILAIGLVTVGYVGRSGRIAWLPYLTGLALAFLVRPHVAVVLAASTGVAYWLGSWRRLTPRRLVEGLALALLIAWTTSRMLGQFGLVDADLEGIREFVERRAAYTLVGGSSLESTPSGLSMAPLAFVNIWMRPLPWDVHNVMSLISGLEVMTLWILVAWRRRGLRAVARGWRRHRLLRFALPFLLAYTLMIGMTFGNLGIIARQRTPLFPFFFLMVTAAPVVARSLERRRRRAPVRGPALLQPAARRP